MAKKNYLNELHSIENMLSKVRSLNEAMAFDSEYDEMDPEMMGQDEVQEMPAEDEAGNEQAQDMSNMNPEEKGMAELDEMGEIDKIREITLSGMHKLCKEPQNPQYQALKKIFQMCDKGVDEEMKQQQGMQK